MLKKMEPRYAQLQSLLTSTIISFFEENSLFFEDLKIQGTVCVTSDSSSIIVTQISEKISADLSCLRGTNIQMYSSPCHRLLNHMSRSSKKQSQNNPSCKYHSWISADGSKKSSVNTGQHTSKGETDANNLSDRSNWDKTTEVLEIAPRNEGQRENDKESLNSGTHHPVAIERGSRKSGAKYTSCGCGTAYSDDLETQLATVKKIKVEKEVQDSNQLHQECQKSPRESVSYSSSLLRDAHRGPCAASGTSDSTDQQSCPRSETGATKYMTAQDNFNNTVLTGSREIEGSEQHIPLPIKSEETNCAYLTLPYDQSAVFPETLDFGPPGGTQGNRSSKDSLHDNLVPSSSGTNIKAVKVGTKMYRCSKCGVIYTSRGSLQKHINTKHYGRKYACKYCNLSFGSVSGWSNHLRVQHKHFLTYECEICSMKFNSRSAKLSHCSRMHSQPGQNSTHEEFQGIL